MKSESVCIHTMLLLFIVCMFFRIILLMKTEGVSCENLSVNATAKPDILPNNISQGNFSINDFQSTPTSSIVQNMNVYLVLLVILFIIFCCVMMAK